MRRTSILLAGTLMLCTVPWPAAAADDIADRRIVSPERLSDEIAVRDVSLQGDSVSGVVANKSGRVLKDVRLSIRYLWLWDNEFHPGTDDPSRVEFATIRQEIPPGSQLPFTAQVDRPLPQRSDGHFIPVVSVVELTTLEKPPATPATAAPAAPMVPRQGGATSGYGAGTQPETR